MPRIGKHPAPAAKTAADGGGSPAPPRSPRAKKQRGDDPMELLDRRIQGEIKPACPVRWFTSYDVDGSCVNEEAELCLTLGWKNYPGDDGILEECLKYLGPEKGYYSSKFGFDEEEFDRGAAEKALRKNEFVRDAYKFTPAGEDSFGGVWYVDFERKKKLTTRIATKILKSLFDGDFFRYPSGWDNFGQTPFCQRGDSDDGGETSDDGNSDDEDGGGAGDQEQDTSLSLVKEYTLSILEGSKYVAHALWNGHAESDVRALVEREDFFFFRTDGGQEFLLRFRWKHDWE